MAGLERPRVRSLYVLLLLILRFHGGGGGGGGRILQWGRCIHFECLYVCKVKETLSSTAIVALALWEGRASCICAILQVAQAAV